MLQIRNGVFETNSSSSHALALAREADYNNHPDVVNFEQGDFGWADEEVSPADYLYTYILTVVMGNYEDDIPASDVFENPYIKDIIYNLSKFGIKCTFDGYGEDNYWGEVIHVGGHIDHQSSDMLATIFDDIMCDEKALYRYLFASHVYTGNDNECSSPDHILKRDYGDAQIGEWNYTTKRYDYTDNPYYDPEHYDYFN